MSTQNQRNANRRNAQHSTGPRTPAGRATASRNAAKHGLLASDLTVLADPANRDSAAALLAEFNDDYRPRTAIERALLRQMAILQHRLETTPAIESGILTHAAYSQFEATLEEAAKFEDPEKRRSWRNQVLGAAFVADCEGPNAFGKLIRYETALSNRFIKCADRFLRNRASGIDQPCEDDSQYADSSQIAELLTPQKPELPNEPNSDLTPSESTPPEAHPDPEPPQNRQAAKPPAPEQHLETPRRPSEPATTPENPAKKDRPA